MHCVGNVAELQKKPAQLNTSLNHKSQAKGSVTATCTPACEPRALPPQQLFRHKPLPSCRASKQPDLGFTAGMLFDAAIAQLEPPANANTAKHTHGCCGTRGSPTTMAELGAAALLSVTTKSCREGLPDDLRALAHAPCACDMHYRGIACGSTDRKDHACCGIAATTCPEVLLAAASTGTSSPLPTQSLLIPKQLPGHPSAT